MIRRVIAGALALAAVALADWVPVGPYGGLVQALAIDGARPGNLWVVPATYPVAPTCFTTTDGGASWQPAGRFELPEVLGMKCDPHQPGLLYACTRGVEFWRSTDAGASWSYVAAPGFITAVAPDPLAAGRVYGAGCADSSGYPVPAAYRSTDYGLTWTEHRFGDGIGVMRTCQADPSRPGVAWAGGDTGRLYRTTDAGATWQPRNAGLPADDAVLALAVNPADPALLLAGMMSGLWRSTDEGATWQPLAGAGKASAVAFCPSDPARAYALRKELDELLWVSTDSGRTWASRAPDTMMRLASVMLVDPSAAGTLCLACRRGVLKTTDGGEHWRLANHGMRFGSADNIGVSPRDERELWVGCDDCRVFASPDLGDSWTLRNGFWCIENGASRSIVVVPEPGGDVIYGLEGRG